MIRETLQKHLDEKYPDMHLTVSSSIFVENPAIYITGHIGYSFAAYPTGTVDQRLLTALEDTKRLVESSIEKVKINLGKPEKILDVDVIRVDDEYWASIGAAYLLMDKVVEVKPLRLEEQTGALFYDKIPIIYKLALDK